MRDVYVVSSCRTAVGSFGGALKDIPAAQLGSVVMKEALARANVKPELLDEVMFGCILTAAQGQNVARQASINAGIPAEVPAYAINMLCGSGMKSVIEAARAIQVGDADLVMRRHREYVRRPLRYPHRPVRRAHGQRQAHRHHDQRRADRRLQQLPYGHHR